MSSLTTDSPYPLKRSSATCLDLHSALDAERRGGKILLGELSAARNQATRLASALKEILTADEWDRTRVFEKALDLMRSERLI